MNAMLECVWILGDYATSLFLTRHQGIVWDSYFLKYDRLYGTAVILLRDSESERQRDRDGRNRDFLFLFLSNQAIGVQTRPTVRVVAAHMRTTHVTLVGCPVLQSMLMSRPQPP